MLAQLPVVGSVQVLVSQPIFLFGPRWRRQRGPSRRLAARRDAMSEVPPRGRRANLRSRMATPVSSRADCRLRAVVDPLAVLKFLPVSYETGERRADAEGRQRLGVPLDEAAGLLED